MRVSLGITKEDNIVQLQKDLDSIFEWKTTNNMRFNNDKFVLLRHGESFRYNKDIPVSEYFTDENEPIPKKKQVRDLGVIVSSSTDFHDHILHVSKNARDKINWIYHNFYSRDPSFLKFMWNSYIQPILDYSSQLWFPSNQTDIKILEDIFRNYSARAQKDNQENLDFWTRVSRYKIKSQQRRAERFRIICTWKILDKLSPNCGISWYYNDRSGRTCTIPIIVQKSLDRVKTSKTPSFQYIGSKLFNSIPFVLREMSGCTLNLFKNIFYKYLNLIPDTPLSQKYYPLPSDVFSSHPSNSIIDWSRYLQIPTRHSKSLDDITQDIKY